LLEIGLDEMPARMIAGAEAELGKRVIELLTRERLLGEGSKATTYSTPRRLAVLMEGVLACQTDTEEKLTGPAWKVAFKDGTPTAAAEAFAKKAGVAVGELEKITTAKGEYAGATLKRRGRAAAELLAAELPKEVLSLYWAKNMYWRAGKPERFVRPVRWVVALLDAAVVPVEIAGIAAGNASRGHRVLHGEAPVALSHAKDYSECLRKAFVMVDVPERRQTIRKALDAATRTVPGARWREDAALIETVVHLTEWPSVVLGKFEPEYLELPEEVLVTVMRDHQKYFAVEGANGKLAAHFLAVLNIEVDEEGRANIVRGNERVLRARFKDARFFWDVDQKIPLTERVESLKNVTFQKELGSYYWKTSGNERIASELQKMASMEKDCPPIDSHALTLAAKLAKTDLTTELVKEFTELQGIIGGLYARAQGLDEKVAKAIYEQYKPASVEDEIPSTVEGQLLGLADRIHMIAEMFDIGLQPTGSRDPFALRRAANSIVRILAESRLPLTIDDVVYSTGKFSGQGAGEAPNSVRTFLLERLSFYLKDVRGFAYDIVNAVLSVGPEDIRDAVARCRAVSEARDSEDFHAISAAFKRMKNILRQAEEKKLAITTTMPVNLAPETLRLYEESATLAPKVAALRGAFSYGEALALIANLRPAVDAFFEKVMVLDPDPAICSANLGLIDEVLSSFSGIADFSEIVTA